jgi:hypothetical protein
VVEVGGVLFEPAVGLAGVPPVLDGGTVAGPPDPAFAGLGVEPALVTGLPVVVGPVTPGVIGVVSPPHPNNAAPATHVDAKSRSEFFMILLRVPRCWALVL